MMTLTGVTPQELVGGTLAIDGTDYDITEYDPATEQFFILAPRADAGEFVSAPRVLRALALGTIAMRARQLTLAGMGG